MTVPTWGREFVGFLVTAVVLFVAGAFALLGLPYVVLVLVPEPVAETLCRGFFPLWTILPFGIVSFGLPIALVARLKSYLPIPEAPL